MGQGRHGSATTTEAIRRAIQHRHESLRAPAKRYGINPKTVAKWKARSTLTDEKTGPKAPHSTVLSIEEEAVIDSQSVKTTESGGPRGDDAGKCIKGHKRHLLTDTNGFLVAAIVHTADIQDRDGAPILLSSIRGTHPW
jgi:hypothetical protein